VTQVIVLFLVAAGEAHARPTLAMQHAVSEVLGSPESALVVEAPPDLTDASAIEQERAVRAAAVVRLSWIDAEHARAELRVHRSGAPEDAWLTRVIGFDHRDAPEEVGRTLGYTVLAMLPGLGLHATLPAPAASGGPGAAPARAPAAAVAVDRAVVGHAPTPSAPYLFLDVVGSASAGLDGIGGGIGGGARVGWATAGRLRLEIGLLARGGEIGPAEAVVTTAALAGGAAVAIARGRRGELSIRGEARAALQLASRASTSTGSTMRQMRWVPGGAAAIEGAVWLTRGLALLMAAGVEVDAGHTDVVVQDRKVATLAAARAIGELGLRMRF
jgi:hypothetical protein